MKNQIERAEPSRGGPDRREIVRSHPEYPRMVEAVNKHFPAGRANSGYAIEAIYDFVTSRESGHVVLLEALRELLTEMKAEFAGNCICELDGQNRHAPLCPIVRAEAAIKQAERA